MEGGGGGAWKLNPWEVVGAAAAAGGGGGGANPNVNVGAVAAAGAGAAEAAGTPKLNVIAGGAAGGAPKEKVVVEGAPNEKVEVGGAEEEEEAAPAGALGLAVSQHLHTGVSSGFKTSQVGQLTKEVGWWKGGESVRG